MRLILSFRTAVANFSASIRLFLCGILLFIFPLLCIPSFLVVLLLARTSSMTFKAVRTHLFVLPTNPFAVVMALSARTRV